MRRVMAFPVLAVALSSCGDDPAFDEQWAAQQRIEELEAAPAVAAYTLNASHPASPRRFIFLMSLSFIEVFRTPLTSMFIYSHFCMAETVDHGDIGRLEALPDGQAAAASHHGASH